MGGNQPLFPTASSPPSVGLTGPAQTTTRGSVMWYRVYQRERSPIDGEKEREKRRNKHLGKYINREHENKTK